MAGSVALLTRSELCFANAVKRNKVFFASQPVSLYLMELPWTTIMSPDRVPHG